MAVKGGGLASLCTEGGGGRIPNAYRPKQMYWKHFVYRQMCYSVDMLMDIETYKIIQNVLLNMDLFKTLFGYLSPTIPSNN